MTVPVRVLVTGGGGQLGRDLQVAFGGGVPDGGAGGSALARAGSPSPGSADLYATTHAALDVADRTAVATVFEGFRPEVVVHAGAYTAVDACESDPERAFATNALGTRHVAEAAARAGAHLLYVSTDYVFDGTADRPYVEWDTPNPVSVYGRSKLGGEREAAALGPACTIVRTAWVCGAHGANMAKTVLRLAKDGDGGPLRFVDDQQGSPTCTADLAPAIVQLALSRRPGIFHVTNQGTTSWYGFAREVLAAAGLDPGQVEPIATADLVPPRPAPRPANSRLANTALALSGLPLLPEWQASLARLVGVLLAGPGPA